MYDFDQGMNKFLTTKVPIIEPTIEDKINNKTMILVLNNNSVVWIENDYGSVSTDYYDNIHEYDREHHDFQLYEDISYKKLGKFIRDNFDGVTQVFLVEN